MNIKRILAAGIVGMTMGFVALGSVEVTGVTAKQRYPWNGLVDIVVTVTGPAGVVADAEWSFVATNSATMAAVPITSIAQDGTAMGSGTNWTRRFVWDAAADVGIVQIDDVALTVDAKVLGVQLWENGPYWAECNVGATKPEEYGYYFWWGDTVGYKRNANDSGWVSVKDGSRFWFYEYPEKCPTYNKDDSSLRSAGYIDSTRNFVAAHDAATAHWGAQWRMPTGAEFYALISNCDTTWTTRDGVYGRLVTGRGMYASESIFLPAAGSDYGYFGSSGYYWSSSVSGAYDAGRAWCLCFGSSEFRRVGTPGRNVVMSVRPVREFAK